MKEDVVAIGPSLPIWLSLPATIILAIALVLALRSVHSRVARFVITAIWLRYILSAFHAFTYKQAFAGQSWNALASILILGVGFLVIDRRNLLLKYLLPLYAVVVTVLVSGMVNASYGSMISTCIKYGYLVVIAIGVYQALRSIGPARFMPSLLWALAPLLIFQVLSIVFNVAKASENDGSVSFIGGYNHEAAFSIGLATCFLVVCFSEKLRASAKYLIITACLTGIFLANYRTTIIALVPIAIYTFYSDGISSFRKDQRSLAVIAIGVIAASFVAVGVSLSAERFSDISIVTENLSEFLKPAGAYSALERRVLSGRPFIWAGYIYDYLAGSQLQHLVGLGPDAWIERRGVYAHNTFVSFLYEYGAIGLIVVVIVQLYFLFLAISTAREVRWRVFFAHLSFIVLNLATMPQWMIEGLLFYAILCGYTFYYVVRARSPVQAWDNK